MMEWLASSREPSTFDAVIVGASVAGAGCASLLSQVGLRVALLDRAEFPRDKICGEGLMPAGVALLERLFTANGSQPPPGFSFQGLRIWREGASETCIDLDFLPGRTGLCLPRYGLDQSLAELAAQTGAQLVTGFRVAAIELEPGGISRVKGVDSKGTAVEYRAPWILAANGIRSRLHEAAGFRLRSADGRFGLRTRMPGFELRGGRVEIFCSGRGEAYVAPQGDGARITFLLEPGALKQAPRPPRTRQWLLEQFPGLAERCSGEGELEATSPLVRRLSGCAVPGFLLLGDAAGSCDPVSGQGMTIALRDAFLVAELARQGLPANPVELAGAYALRRRQYFEPAFALSQRLLQIVRSPFLARRFGRLLRRSETFARKISTIATLGASAQREVGWLDRLRLLAGI